MKFLRYFSISFLIILFNLTCHNIPKGGISNSQRFKRNPLIYSKNKNIDFAVINEDDIENATEYVLREADLILSEIITVPTAERTFANTLLRLDDLYNIVSKVSSPLELLASVHPNRKIRDISDVSILIIQKYFIELSANEALYEVVYQFSISKQAHELPLNQQRFLESELRDFQHSGLGLSEYDREKLKRIQNRISELSLQFENNISSYSDTLFIPHNMIAGLPDDYKENHLQADGKYAIDLSYPSFYPFMIYAESDSLRKLLRYMFLNKGMPQNVSILSEILANRKSLAELLNYPSFSALIIDQGMAKSTEAVWEFEKDLIEKIQPKANWDTKQLLQLKYDTIEGNDKTITDWQKDYYENQLLLKKHRVDSEEVKQYFQVDNVIEGLFAISSLLFDIKFREIENPSVWHSGVRMFEMKEKSDNALVGYFYLDLYPREDKYQHAAAFSIVSGKKINSDYQHPIACLVCNFPPPGKNTPALLQHEDVETLFHEFGHLLHDMLTTSELYSQSGTSVAMDFVEAPSQMIENWVWNKESLSLFATHYETNEIIPDSLLNRMMKARNIQSGNNLLQQIFYGMLDLTLHEQFDSSNVKSTTEIMSELQNSITNYDYIEGTHMQASFDHLLDYGASYYGYLWSEVFAADMYSTFEKEGVLNQEVGLRFRKTILEKGGTENPMNLVRAFLRRDPNNEAFLKKQGIVE
ncbi:MAG: M3 family metallopeptidase [Candidatus Marinimicrobia bacterium]|nr:M3 family metallopeptidase [Candidatus Neomarinimicrobiota bacterium]